MEFINAVFQIAIIIVAFFAVYNLFKLFFDSSTYGTGYVDYTNEKEFFKRVNNWRKGVKDEDDADKENTK